MKEIASADTNHFQGEGVRLVHIRIQVSQTPTSAPEVRIYTGFDSLVVQYMSQNDYL